MMEGDLTLWYAAAADGDVKYKRRCSYAIQDWIYKAFYIWYCIYIYTGRVLQIP